MTDQPLPTQTPSAAPSDPIEADAVVIGAGPVGLFQVFELGLLEIRAHVIDSLAAVGGQCVELYPDKPIYDIPALPVISGQALADNLMEQIRPFSPTFHLGQEVRELARLDDGRFHLRTSAGTAFIARTVFIAAGAGSFQVRKLMLDGIARFEDRQLFYRVRDARDFDGRRVLVAGGGDSALDWAIALVERGADVTLVHRRDSFRAAPASVARMHALRDAGRLRFLVGQIDGYAVDGDRIESVTVAVVGGSAQTVAVDALLVLYGLSPSLGPIADWGLDIERRQVRVDTEKFETSVPGLFAVGDINTYPGKKKLILCGFHEAALAAFAAAAHVFPSRRIHLQYTTTSTKLHAVLGVESPAPSPD